jgi:hypothetical protein
VEEVKDPQSLCASQAGEEGIGALGKALRGLGGSWM